MSSVIKVNEFDKAISGLLEGYEEEVTTIVAEETEKAIKYAVKELKANSPKKSGKYASSWKQKTEKKRLSTEAVAYNEKHYRITHLLEFGHAKRGGGRTGGKVEPRPHIEKVNDATMRMLEEGISKRL